LNSDDPYSREAALQPILYGMTKRGIAVDIDKLNQASFIYSGRAALIGKGLEEEFGLSNPASSKQVARLLYEELGLPVLLTTKHGAPATDKNALEMLQGDPVAARVLEYRKWTHARTSYADSFAAFARLSADGRIHGHFRSDGTVTGRLSASGPNVMTIPRDDSLPEISAAFATAASGCALYKFDLASAELWITASFTGDPVLTSILKEGRSIHLEMMQRVFGGAPDKSRREYTLSKNVVYGVNYGAGLEQIAIFAAKAGYSPREAHRVAKVARDGHKALFSRQHKMADRFAELAEELGQLPLITPGRYRHFHSPGKQVPYYQAMSSMVQGGCAEWVKTVMLEVDARGYGELLVLQCHDELWFEGPPGMQQELQELLDSITRDCNPFKFPIPWLPK
jgi:DNA polymerase-1